MNNFQPISIILRVFVIIFLFESPAMGCSLCMDSKTLAYVPTANLIAPTIFLYVLCRFIVLKIFQQRISFGKIVLFVIAFFGVGSVVGSYSILLVYAGIFILWHSFDAYKRTNHKLQRIEYGLVLTLFITLCILFGIGQQRKYDENWLLSHLNLIGGEINYNRLQEMIPLKGLCTKIQNTQVFDSSHFRNIEYLSKLAIKQNDCQKEIQRVFDQSQNQWLYVAMVRMTPQDDPKWKDICNHYVQFKNEENYKFEQEDLQMIENKVRTICSAKK